MKINQDFLNQQVSNINDLTGGEFAAGQLFGLSWSLGQALENGGLRCLFSHKSKKELSEAIDAFILGLRWQNKK